MNRILIRYEYLKPGVKCLEVDLLDTAHHIYHQKLNVLCYK